MIKGSDGGLGLDVDDLFTRAMLDFDPDDGAHDYDHNYDHDYDDHNDDHNDQPGGKREKGEAPLHTVATREMLKAMDPDHVYVLDCPPAGERKWYRNVLPEVPVVLCRACNHFFNQEEWERQIVKSGGCAFCGVEAHDDGYFGSVSSRSERPTSSGQ